MASSFTLFATCCSLHVGACELEIHFQSQAPFLILKATLKLILDFDLSSNKGVTELTYVV
jgi:hypothetical protein